jgi:hypothetical protein
MDDSELDPSRLTGSGAARSNGSNSARSCLSAQGRRGDSLRAEQCEGEILKGGVRRRPPQFDRRCNENSNLGGRFRVLHKPA